MGSNGNYRRHGLEPHAIGWGGHKRVQHCVSFDPELERWISREQVAGGLSFSEVVNRELKKQHDLRQQLSGLTSIDGEQQTPVYQVLLEQFGQKVGRTVDGAMRDITVVQAMVAAFAEIAMSPEQFSRWERTVTEGRKKPC